LSGTIFSDFYLLLFLLVLLTPIGMQERRKVRRFSHVLT